jgi:hypothetical protein
MGENPRSSLMTRRTTIETVDDLDGGLADERVTFAFDDVTYELDLSAANAIKLRSTLQPYVAAGRRTGGRPVPRAMIRPTRKAPTRTRRDPEQTKAIRTWAQNHGYPISPRGKITDEIAAAFDAGG